MANFMISGIIKFMDEATPTVQKIDTALKDLQQRSEKIGEGIGNITPALKGFAVAGTAVAGGIGFAVKQAADFEQALQGLSATNQVTQREIDNLGAAAITLASRTKFAAVDILTGTKALVATGASAQEATAAMKPISQAAKVVGTDYATMAKLISDATEGMGRDFKEIPLITDQIAAASKAGTIQIDQLASALANTQAISQKMDFAQMTASLTSLIDAGIEGGSAAQMLSLSMNQLLNPSEDIQKIWGGMGKTMKQFTDSSGKLLPMPKIIKNIQKALDAQGNEMQRNQLLIDLFGARGEKTFAILKKAVADGKFENITDAIKNAHGSMDAMAANMKPTLNDTIKKFFNNVNNALILLGSMPLPMVTEMFDKFGKTLQTGVLALQGFLGAGEKTPEMIAAMDSEVGQFLKGFIKGSKEMIETVKSMASTFMSFMKILVPGTKDGAEGFGQLTAKVLGFMAVAGPLVAGALAAASAFTTLFTAGKGVFQIFTALFPAFGSLSTAIPFLTNGLSALNALMKGQIMFSTFLSTIFPNLTNAVKLLGTAFSTLGTALRIVAAFFFTNPIGLAITAVTALIGGLYLLARNWDTVKAKVMGLLDAIGPVGQAIFKFLVFPLRMALTPLMELIRLLASTRLGMKALEKMGIDPKNVEDMTRTISLVPRMEDAQKQNLVAAAATVTQPMEVPGGPDLAAAASQAAAERTQAAAELTDMAAGTQASLSPPSSQPNVNVQVAQPPIQATFTIPVQIDGREVGRAVGKQMVENSERRGQTLSASQKNSVLSNGPMAVPVGAQ